MLCNIVRYTFTLSKLQNIGLYHLNCLTRKQHNTTQGIDFRNENLQKYLGKLRQEFYELRVNASGNAFTYERINQLNGIVEALEHHRVLEGNIPTEKDIKNEKDEEMRKLIEEEIEVYNGLMQKTEQKLIAHLLELSDDETYPSLIFEINAGAGGQEAMLFARELYEMYTNFFEHKGWDYTIVAKESTDIGGLRHANMIVQDIEAYKWLRHEAGVHRVQRVPSTEKSGRIHTSTASIAVIPRPADINVTIAEKDLKIETKRASGAGGQHVNTTDSAVRIVHLPTGVAVESQSERSQIKNREIAIKRLQQKLLQQQLESAESKKQATRKAQQGNLDRSEKIRTYNFVQDRITDHRIQAGTIHNLDEFLEGGMHLGNLIERLIKENQKVKLLELLENKQYNEKAGLEKQSEKSET